MSAAASALGLDPASEVWIVARAAVHVQAGMLVRDAIEQAMRDLLAFWTEMAQCRTTRAKLAHVAIVRRMYAAIRLEVR